MVHPADRQARLGVLLTSGLLRAAGRSPLSKVQWLLLALFVAGAVILGLLLQPRRAEEGSRDPLPIRTMATGAPPAPAAGAAAGETANALDRLAKEVSAINEKLDAVVASEKRTTQRVSALEGAGAARSEAPRTERGASDADREASRSGPARPDAKRRREALTVHRKPAAHAAALPVVRPEPARPPAKVLARRAETRRTVRERRRRQAASRSSFGLLPNL